MCCIAVQVDCDTKYADLDHREGRYHVAPEAKVQEPI